MALLIDEAWAKSSPDAVKAAGYSGIIGYVSQDTTGKNLTEQDVAAIHAAGLDVGLVYEYATESALGRVTAGEADSSVAIAHALGLQAPPGVCLYAAADWDVQASQMDDVFAYAVAFQARCAAVGYRAGIYGSYALCKYLRENGYTGLLWQTYAWSAGLLLAGVQVYQSANGIHVAGTVVDKDIAYAADWGQWRPEGGSGFMVQPQASEVDNVYAGLFYGGDSCGTVVPPEFRCASDQHGNALFSKLNYIQALLEKWSAAGVSQDMLDTAITYGMAQPGVIGPLAAAIASHIRVQ